MKYKIGYNHRSTGTAHSRRDALRQIRVEARIEKQFGAAPRLRHVEGCDGEYIYSSTERMNNDADGSRAFAIISPA